MTSLFIDRRSTELEYHSGAIIFRNKGERIGTIPMAPLTRVFLRGDVKLSASLLGKLGEKGVGVIVLSGGVFQGSWNMTYATSNGLRSSMTSVDFSGLSQTLPTGCQLRVFPDQRAGLSRLACW